MRRAVIAFSLAAAGAGCVADPDGPRLPQFDVRAQLQPSDLSQDGRNRLPTVWSDLPIARKLVERRTVIAVTEPASVAEGELVWKPATVLSPPQPSRDEPKGELPKPTLTPAADESPTWGKAERR